MKFKELRDLIYSPCKVVLKNRSNFVSTHEATEFDECIVIGIRSKSDASCEEYIEVNLKENK